MVGQAVALVVGGAFLSSFLEVLFDRVITVKSMKLISNVFQKIKLKDDLLEKMEMLLLTVDKVLDDAEDKQIINTCVKKWLDKLKDAAYDAEDLLDAIVIEGDQAQEKQVKDFNARLEKIVSKLKLIAKEKNILSLKEGQRGKSIPRLPTTSLVDESEECLRYDDKNHLLDILLSDRKGIPAIAIVGMGGIGKTTLAQFLYNDVKVKNYFNLRAWVHVSEELDVIKVTKTIYESVTLSHCDINDLNVLQVRLQRTLMGRKFLLVLDDVWNGSLRGWDLLRTPLQDGAAGSKIIITTRNQGVSSIIHDVLVHDLKMLSKEDCWQLFAKHAFGDKDPDEDPTLKGIGEQIVKKCKGLPLAIKTLGSLLHSEVEVEEWNNVFNSRVWDLPDHKSDILPALRLSYHYLPSHLKRCFEYCSIFPKGHKFKKGDLVRMWIAEGFVQQPNGRRRKEEVGEQYFHELLSRSIFQQNNDQSNFTMHDLLNDLAQYVAGEFCFKFEHDSPLQNPARVRHLSFSVNASDTPDKLGAFYETNKVLRTFFPLKSQRGGKPLFPSGVFNRLFPEGSCLRVLSLSPYKITQFPDSVGNLKQLRYLDLSKTDIQCLPQSVGCLYNLETLKLTSCHRLTLLPENLCNLTKLEHLDMYRTCISEFPDSIGNLEQLGYLDLSGTKIRSLPESICSLHNLLTLKLSTCPQLTCLPTDMEHLTKLKHLHVKETPILEMPPNFGNLKCLQLLTNFVVGENSVSTISEVGKLSLLSGSLCISRLQNVSQTADAEQANLRNKKYLHDLIFEWDADPCNGDAQNATNDLQDNGNAQNAADDPQNGNTVNAADDPHDNCNAQNSADDPQNRNTVDAADDLHDNCDAQNAAEDPQNRNTENAANDLQNNGNAQNVADDPQNGNTEKSANDLHDNGNAQPVAEGPHDSSKPKALNDPLNGDVQNAVNDPHSEDKLHNSQTENAQSAMDSPQSRNEQTAGEGGLENRKEHAANVLDRLQPSENLERLKIKNFLGMRLPTWLGNDSFSKMESLTLDKCQNCTSLPPLGQLPSLKVLAIYDLAGVKSVDQDFYGGGVVAFKSLETLLFERMENWEEWLPFENEQGFPSLHTLCLLECKKLTGDLPIQHPNLNVSIDGCDKFRSQVPNTNNIDGNP